MQTDSVEKAAGVGVHWLMGCNARLAWLACCLICGLHDAGLSNRHSVKPLKMANWSSHKARQGLWHKGGSIIMVFSQCLNRYFAWANAESHFRTYASF